MNNHLILFCFVFQLSPEGLLTWDTLTGEAGDSGIINMEDEDDDDLSDQVNTIRQNLQNCNL